MDKKPAVFCVVGHADYESANDVVGAFLSKKSADAFVESCREYDRNRPQWPHESDFADEEKYERACQRHMRKDDRWRKKHPAGNDWSNYYVTRVEVRE